MQPWKTSIVKLVHWRNAIESLYLASFRQLLKCKCILPRLWRLECTWAYTSLNSCSMTKFNLASLSIIFCLIFDELSKVILSKLAYSNNLNIQFMLIHVIPHFFSISAWSYPNAITSGLMFSITSPMSRFS